MSGVISGLSNLAAQTSNIASDISSLATGGYGARGTLGIWAATLQPASFRGVPFGVYSSTVKTGRRTAVHVYPYRDEVWVEDIGLGNRIFAFRGFLVGDDVFAQRDRMVSAVETAGPGVLVHPSIGSRNCSIIDFSATERAELGRVVELEITAMQTVGSVTPIAIAQTQKGVLGAVSSALAAAAKDFNTYVAAPLAYGEGVVQKVVAITSLWQSTAMQLSGDASLLADAVNGLTGNYGRYNSGNLTTPAASNATISGVLSAAITNKTAVASASASLTIAADGLAATSTGAFVAAAQGVAEALIAAAVSPADQVRLMTKLQAFSPLIVTGTEGTIGAAISTAQTGVAAVLRRVAMAELASACASYQPTSSNDAQALLASVTAIFDAEITIAADAAQDATYLALRTMRTAVAKDLIVRGANLPSLQTVNVKSCQPSLALAYMLYQDAKRADELTQRVDPIHPGFFPITFEALSA